MSLIGTDGAVSVVLCVCVCWGGGGKSTYIHIPVVLLETFCIVYVSLNRIQDRNIGVRTVLH